MKKLHLLLLSITLCVFSACHNDIWDAIDGLDGRVTKLEELCKEMNTNITSLQTIVDVLQSNDFITGVVEIKKDGEVLGYTITFGKHDPITIYHGQDGKDGADGKDGQDGQNGSANAPVIGVAQDTDGVYYWTLNGEWLLDDNGNKLPVSGKDGANGADGKDGQDGKDGADGQDGKDGITPQLKIEDGYWYISYDNGATWTQLGKATGEDGKDGADGQDGQNGTNGKDGQDGDSMFQSVTQDENYVYFTLADGTIIKITKDNTQFDDDFIFTITYDANGGSGIVKTDTIYYGEIAIISTCEYTKMGFHFSHWNTKPNGSGVSYWAGSQLYIYKNITLYAQWSDQMPTSGVENGHDWVDLGLSVKWATCNIGATKQEEFGDYFAWGEVYPKETYTWSNYQHGGIAPSALTKYTLDYMYSTIRDGKSVLDACDDAAVINWGGKWRMPSSSELYELTSCTWTLTKINGVDGFLVTAKNGNNIFIPFTQGSSGRYWSNTLSGASYDQLKANCLYFDSNNRRAEGYDRATGLTIRPVCP